MINDLPENSTLINRDKRRFDYLIPNYLSHYINKSDKICSIGCGSGYDVELLNLLGYDAYGFDPGSRTKAWAQRNPETQNKLRMGSSDDFPFGTEQFDFVYALEVIEHVGCKDGVWILLDDARQTRRNFIEDCLAMLKPKGRFLITVANRLFPVDMGHGHHYHWITNGIFNKTGVSITIPWHPKNFLLSFKDIEGLLLSTKFGNSIKISSLSLRGFLAFSSHPLGRTTQKFGKFIVRNYYCIASSTELLRRSVFNPFLIIVVTREI